LNMYPATGEIPKAKFVSDSLSPSNSTSSYTNPNPVRRSMKGELPSEFLI
jgi:hypothetical protein